LLLECVYIPEEESSCRAVVHTGGLESIVDSPNAEVTILYDIIDGVVLGHPEWTGLHTSQAANTFLSMEEDDPVWALGYRIDRARV
jgi:hypothetical protein